MTRSIAAQLLVIASMTGAFLTGAPWASPQSTPPPSHAVTAPVPCLAGSARSNAAHPIESGADYVPLTYDDALGFYVSYSARTLNGVTPNYNVGQFLFELDGNEVLLFGAGYGDFAVALHGAAHDAQQVDAILRHCMGKSPKSTPIRFVSPHWHGDHINAEFVRALEAYGWRFAEILYHEDDDFYIQSYYNWLPRDVAKFTQLTHGGCNQEIHAFSSPLGKIWFIARKGHAPGAIDLVVDVRDNPNDRVVVLGSVEGGACPDPPGGTRQVFAAHGNAQLLHKPQIVHHGCGFNAAGSLQVLSGQPRVGGTVVLGIDDPPGDMPLGSLPYLWASVRMTPHLPCGRTLNLTGMPRPAKVLLGTAPGDLMGLPEIGAPWSGSGNPALISVSFPNDASLVGVSVFYQGGLIQPTVGPGEVLILTTAIEMRIGP